ncbi:glutamate carboxypeptidase like protein [Verticillium longisporum]|nr:glutamate carboxypeptidase like protein [Verticillium longisporum]
MSLNAHDLAQLRAALQDAVVKCSERCLYQSAKWAAELLDAIPEPSHEAQPDESTLPSGQYLALLAYHLLDDEILPLDVVNYGVELQAYLDDLVEFSAENDADLDFSELEDAIEVFKKRAGEAKALEELAVTTNDQNLKDVVNHKYIHFQRGFVSQGGLPNREFYRHVVAAPGLDTGYAAVTFAGATEGIQYAEDGNFNVAQEWVSKIAAGIVVAADILKT